jgi:predicted membrane protein
MRPNIFGVILVLFGFLFLLDNLGIADFGDVIHRFWPLIPIIIGLRMILRSQRKSNNTYTQTAPPIGTVPPPQPEPTFTQSSPSMSTEMLNLSEVFGDLRFDITSSNFRGGRISNVFGDVRLDLTKCTLADGDSVLDISTVFGGITLLVPCEMPFTIQSNVSFGDIRIFDQKSDGMFKKLNYKTSNFDSSPKRLHIVTSSVFGDCKVW